MASIKSTKGWTRHGMNGFDSLKFNEQIPLPELTDHDVLVQIHAVSLNYRDLIITKGGYPWTTRDGIVPGSDGAGEVLAVGSKVTRFRKGDNVVTLFNQGHLSGPLNKKTILTGLGGTLDGTLRQYGVFSEDGLVEMPPSLSWLEASTLSCAALTSWNALYGLKPLVPGQVVLTQGTGGVSLFSVQFAKAAGAKVIATTSSARKCKILKNLGADHIINYNEIAEWGKEAKNLTPNGDGADHVVEVGGPGTMAQSLEAVKIDGVISIIGFLAEAEKKQPSFLEILNRIIIVRGALVGSRMQFEEMNRAIEANTIKPVVDSKVFKLEELREAYQYMWDKKHIGKVCIQID